MGRQRAGHNHCNRSRITGLAGYSPRESDSRQAAGRATLSRKGSLWGMLSVNEFSPGAATQGLAGLAVKRALRHAVAAARITMPYFSPALLAAIEEFAATGDDAALRDMDLTHWLSRYVPDGAGTPVIWALLDIYHWSRQADPAGLAALRAVSACVNYAQGDWWGTIVYACESAYYHTYARGVDTAGAERTELDQIFAEGA